MRAFSPSFALREFKMTQSPTHRGTPGLWSARRGAGRDRGKIPTGRLTVPSSARTKVTDLSVGFAQVASWRDRLLANRAAGRGVQALVAVARHSSNASSRRAQPKASGHLTFAQHKPYSFLSPSGNPRRSALFALDLLSSKNAQKKSDQRLCQTSGDPCGLPGLACAGRLDADSTGLMLWSTDKRFIERIIGPSSLVEKECAPGPGRAARGTPVATLSRVRVQI